MRRRKADDNAKFNGLQIVVIDKKIKSQLYLTLGKEGQKCFSYKNPGKRKLELSFAEFWDLLKITFTVTTNLTYARYNLFNRRQKNHESLETFYEILSELAKSLKLGKLEAELFRDFCHKYANCGNFEKICIEYLTPKKCVSIRVSPQERYKNTPTVHKIPWI